MEIEIMNDDVFEKQQEKQQEKNSTDIPTNDVVVGPKKIFVRKRVLTEKKKKDIGVKFNDFVLQMTKMGFVVTTTIDEMYEKWNDCPYTHIDVEYHRTKDQSIKLKSQICNLKSGHTKGELPDEKAQRNKEKSDETKGQALTQKAEHAVIEAISKLIDIKFEILRELRFYDFAFLYLGLYIAVQITVIKFSEASGCQNTHKTIGKIIQYLELGGCFIVAVMLKGEIKGYYFLNTTHIQSLLDFKSPDVMFHPSPFTTQKPGSAFQEFMKANYYNGDIATSLKNHLLDFAKTATTFTLEFLDEDKSMMSQTNYIEQLYMTKLINAIGRQNYQYVDSQIGDIIIIGALIEMKKSRKTKSKNGYQSGFMHEQKSSGTRGEMDIEKVHVLGTVEPDLSGVTFWPTKVGGKNAFDYGGLSVDRLSFGYQRIDGKYTSNGHADPSQAYFFDFKKGNLDDLYSVLKKFSERETDVDAQTTTIIRDIIINILDTILVATNTIITNDQTTIIPNDQSTSKKRVLENVDEIVVNKQPRII